MISCRCHAGAALVSCWMSFSQACNMLANSVEMFSLGLNQGEHDYQYWLKQNSLPVIFDLALIAFACWGFSACLSQQEIYRVGVECKLFFFLLAVLVTASFALCALVLPENFEHYLNLVKALEIPNWILFSGKTVLAWPLCYHAFNGIRHLVWV